MPMNDGKTGYITCSGREDGVGAQMHGMLSAMLFCHDNGINYVHTPISKISHKQKNQGNWEQDWENFFNLGKDEINISEICDLNLKSIKINDPATLPFQQENILFIVPHCHHYTDRFPDNYKSLKDNFLEKYNSTAKDKYKVYNCPNKINIALHIRRGDVSQVECPTRYTDNESIAKVLARVQSILSDFKREISINIFSEGSTEHFQELKGRNVNFYLDYCLFKTFHALVCADILLMAKSSFSYTAALLSRGIKMYDPFWHKPQKDWIIKNELAQFDERVFKDKVYDRLLEGRRRPLSR